MDIYEYTCVYTCWTFYCIGQDMQQSIIVWQRFCEPCQTKNCILSVCACVPASVRACLESCFIAIYISVKPSQTAMIYYQGAHGLFV